MNILVGVQDALKETGKAKRDMWGEKEYVRKEGMHFVDNEGKPFNREDIAEDVWQPYHEVKEITPEKAGELWKDEHKGIAVTIIPFNKEKLHFQYVYGDDKALLYDPKGWHGEIIHGKNGWTRLFPKVEDESAERIEIEGVEWAEAGDNVVFPFQELDDYDWHRLVGKAPMKLVCILPKETS